MRRSVRKLSRLWTRGSLNSLSLYDLNKIIIIFSDESSNKSISKFYIKLIEKGGKNILVYKKGIEDWMENGFPIEKANI